MRAASAIVVASMLVATVFAAPVTANESPLADAGLDQTVSKGATVLLDASGSRDPDGEITSYRWTISPPESGGVSAPDCTDCPRTRFRPTRVGVYEVTVTVTDDDGALTNDTLFVTVEPGEGPSISLSGPTATSVGTAVSYTASVEAGSATLQEVVWTVDGSRVARRNVSGEGARVTLPYAFAAPGIETVAATVVDADGLRATDSVSVDVEPSSESGNAGSPGPVTPPGGGGSPVPMADRFSPTVRGDQLLQGRAPFEGSYTLDVATDDVSVTWWADGRRAGSGMARSKAWTSGEHDIYALVVYGDGSSELARFPDGSTRIEVDPQPRVSLSRLRGIGSISGVVEATDEFGNLRHVSVLVDGTQVASETVGVGRVRRDSSGGRLALSFEESEVTPDRQYSVTVRARDARGQTVTTTETVRAVGQPQVIRSEFVNGPVDSYHPRIDPERYVAHHVLEVDLNGVDPENLSIVSAGNRSNVKRIKSDTFEWNRRYDSAQDKVIYNSYWAGYNPNGYKIAQSISHEDPEYHGLNIKESSIFSVTPSLPELRYEVISDGTPHHKGSWGIVVNAEDSFDPDHTDINYIWLSGAEASEADEAIGKFDSLRMGGLKIEDGYQLSVTTGPKTFLSHYNPGIAHVKEISDGPYKPNDTVKFWVKTNPYKFPKNTYNIDLELSTPTDAGTVIEWAEETNETLLNPEIRNSEMYNGTVEFKASSVNGLNRANLHLSNTHAPSETKIKVPLPSILVFEKGGLLVSNVDVIDTSYLVEQTETKRRSTTLQPRLDSYRQRGYSVADVVESGTEYVLEKRVKVQDAKYDTRTREFDSRGRRGTFLELHPDWRADGTKTETRRWTETHTEWRNSKGGKGEFTGETRRSLVEPAEYRTERQYRHEYQVEKTGTRYVTKTKTVLEPVTRYRWVTKCREFLGCHRVRQPYTDWVTRRVTYRTTEEYSYTVTRSETYWSFTKRHWDDEYTGHSRRIQVEDAEYTTQYEFRYREQQTRQVRRYLAQRKILIQPAKYEWQEYKTTRSEVVAGSIDAMPNRRVGDQEPIKKWFLVKRDTREIWTDEYQSSSKVLKTKATVNETIAQEYIDPIKRHSKIETVRYRSEKYIFEGYLSPKEIEMKREDSKLNKED